jgi:hypothetical protein
MKRWLYLIPLFLIIVCFGISIKTRASYQSGLQERILNYDYQANDKLEDVFNKSNINISAFHSSADLIQQADLIVKCRFSGNRQVTDEAFYTSIFVTDVYKGDKERKGKTLTVIETVYIIENYHITPNLFSISNHRFYIPLQNGNDYLLLLKKLPLNEARKPNEFLDSQYYPVSQSAFGVYRMSNIKQTKLVDPEKNHTPFNKLSEFDLFATNQKQLDTYYQYKQQIFKTIGA